MYRISSGLLLPSTCYGRRINQFLIDFFLVWQTSLVLSVELSDEKETGKRQMPLIQLVFQRANISSA